MFRFFQLNFVLSDKILQKQRDRRCLERLVEVKKALCGFVTEMDGCMALHIGPCFNKISRLFSLF